MAALSPGTTIYSHTGRWAEAPIDAGTAAMITPAAAGEYIGSATSRIVGGSYYGHAGKRIEKPGWPARLAVLVCRNGKIVGDGTLRRTKPIARSGY